ncbi:methyl-accepting chemotaxis protein [Ruminococcaceae bacterium OttesenSCG-928-L11]|nr:methyl-accepting chemotaxis protein [Ruminococcaceae bacterium OttesenSCG-928-L11]
MTTKANRSIATQISLLIVIMVLLSAVTVSVTSIVLYQKDTIDANARRATDIAQSAASLIQPEEYTRIMETGEKTDHWYHVKASLDNIITRTGTKYLYVLDANYTDSMTYFAEGIGPNSGEEAIDLGAHEPLVIDGEDVYSPEMFQVLKDGTPRNTDIYDSGDFGRMVSGFAPVLDDSGRILGVVGVDISLQEVMASIYSFTFRVLLITLAFCIVFGLLSVRFMRKMIGEPINQLSAASDQMAQGDINVSTNINRNDEIGVLSDSFLHMAEGIRTQSAVLEQLSQGDLTMQVSARSDKDVMNLALSQTLTNLNQIMGEIQDSTVQVSAASAQIAQAAQSLATGSAEQAATIEEFTATVNDLRAQSEKNAAQAADACADSQQAGTLMSVSMRSMQDMVVAMQEINESSEEIGKIIKVIDDIAFQTNILALNAAVEAARAGQHGKGFAVVADEVRNLASKSAEAAKSTAGLIEASTQKISEGVAIAQQTSDSLSSVAVLAQSNADAMNAISAASQLQNSSITTLTSGMDQIASVVQTNSATAEESAAAAEEMSSQAQVLNAIVSRFRIQR